MIPSKRWEDSLKEAITDPATLIKALKLDPNMLTEVAQAAALFPLKVPQSYLDRIEKGNRYDPLLLQVLPVIDELDSPADYSVDPLNEKNVNPIPGLLHKYAGRVLLTFVGTCAINCRYCFRRHFPYGDNNPGKEWEAALQYIEKDPSIHEVILSGGDPLIATDRTLHTFSQNLSAIAHVKRLRIHTRMPIVMPERITQAFCDWLAELPQQPILVLHCNHPHEINQSVIDKLALLKDAGVTLLNQSVLLKGVNDSVDVLVALSEKLFAAGVIPYYLHLLDKVQGSAHFDTQKKKAIALHSAMEAKLSGFLVPKLVWEESGAQSKTRVI